MTPNPDTALLISSIGDAPNPSASASKVLFADSERLARLLAPSRLAVRLTLDSQSVVVGTSSPSRKPVEFKFSSQAILTRVMRRFRFLDFAMAYLEGTMTINGSIFDAIDVLDAINLSTDQRETIFEFSARLFVRALKVVIPSYAMHFESLEHYSHSARAYELFLDKHMQYTCGRFEHDSYDIDQAQIAKFHLIHDLASKHAGPLTGKRHLDIGCGWGGMCDFFQNHLGMQSFGNTNSAAQAAYVFKRYGRSVIFGDFVRLRGSTEEFDLITIVGMIEHLTPFRRKQLLRTAHKLLKPNGVLYLQCITKPNRWIGGDAYRVAKREVFPGHFLESSEQTEQRLIDCGFRILEQFNHHHDYAMTTARWVEKIQKNEKTMTALLGPSRYRMYLGYLAYASKLFDDPSRGCLMRYFAQRSS